MTGQDRRQVGVYLERTGWWPREFGLHPTCKKSHPMKASELGETMAAGCWLCWLSSSRNEGKRTDGNHHEPYNHITDAPAEQTSKGHHRAIINTFIKDDKCTLSLWLKLSLLWYWLLEDVKVFKILKWEKVNEKNKIINAQIRFLHVLTSYLHKKKEVCPWWALSGLNSAHS